MSFNDRKLKFQTHKMAEKVKKFDEVVRHGSWGSLFHYLWRSVLDDVVSSEATRLVEMQ